MALMRFERAHEAIPESRRTVLVGDILNVDSMTFNCKFKDHGFVGDLHMLYTDILGTVE